MYLAILYSWIHWGCFILIQLKRTTSGEISGLEYGQLGVEIPGSGAYGQLYVGTSLGASVPVIHEPYFPEGIMINDSTSYIKWNDSEVLGCSLEMSSAGRISIDTTDAYDIDITSGGNINLGATGAIDIVAARDFSSIYLTGPQIGLSASKSISISTDNIVMNDRSSSNQIYISSPGTIIIDAAGIERVSGPMTDNDLVTKKYVSNLSYSPQASINTGTMVIMGFVRQLNEVLFSIPLDWQLSETSFYDCQFKSGNMEVMQGDANTDTSPTYIFGGRQGGQPVVGNVKVGNVYRGKNILTIRMVRENGSNFTNAHTGPCCIMLRNVVISGTPLS